MTDGLATAPAVALKNDLFLRAARGEVTERPPVWMMRQAGRYLPQYRAVRAKSDFLTMCRTPELAVEVTLQPVELLHVDAAIIFSDILVVPQALGMELHMDEGVGPQFPDPIRKAADLGRLREVDVETDLKYMLDGVRLARRELNGRVPLIGFAGAPWTLASYMVEGKGTKNFHVAKRMLVEAPEMAHALLSRLATVVGNFLVAQVRAGAQAVQLFDSWAGALAPAEFRQFALPYLARSCAIARTAGVPVTVFAPGAGWALEHLIEATGCDVLGIDWQQEPSDVRKRLAGHRVALQGNLDPSLLFGKPEFVAHRTRKMLDAFGSSGYIANLGHGILPETPVESARAFIDTVREWTAPGAPAPAAPAPVSGTAPYGRSSALLA